MRHARGAHLPFYKDFKIGLETRRRLRKAMLRFAPDVVHIASPATLGYQAAKAAAELGIPTVAIYQTDLVGFAERYDVPGGAAGVAALTRRIHTRVDRTLAPSSASLRQLADLDVPGTALWPRGVDLEQFHPGHRDASLRARLLGDDPADTVLVGYVGRLAPEKELDLLGVLADDPRHALVVVGGGPRGAAAAVPAPRGALPRRPARRGPRRGVRLARRLRPHRAPRDLLPVGPGGPRVRRPGGRPAPGRTDRRGGRRRRRLPLPARRRRRPGDVRRPARRPTRCCATGWARPLAAASPAGRGPRSTVPWSSTTAR